MKVRQDDGMVRFVISPDGPKNELTAARAKARTKTIVRKMQFILNYPCAIAQFEFV